jgi:hypothetical protein
MALLLDFQLPLNLEGFYRLRKSATFTSFFKKINFKKEALDLEADVRVVFTVLYRSSRLVSSCTLA